ncbi:GNAT family N-acetyltransferase [Luxibacter massiliensis]|uniref:GNAT family N-acetyltransferase n=1 Tax=Luxibacter massiliensis TaxID=2219695 RepID=UPI000F05C0B8|nr:GNAT family N-acetyltransferase [Luxibacter massiliensis]
MGSGGKCRRMAADDAENGLTVRLADLSDAGQILEIYAYYVENTAITFEYQVPTLEEFRGRISKIAERYPYLVAESNGGIQGYCYAASFKDRDAYNWAVETTVYVKQGCRGRGVGKVLYECMEAVLRKQNILNLNACIAYPNPESIAFHEKMGYKVAAHFHKCGYKHGVWYDMVWMEKFLGEHPEEPQDVIPAARFAEQAVKKIK